MKVFQFKNVEDAAEAISSAMNQFGVSEKDAKIIDILAKEGLKKKNKKRIK